MAKENNSNKNKKNTNKVNTNSKKNVSKVNTSSKKDAPKKSVDKNTKVVTNSANKKNDVKKDIKKEVSKIEVPKFEKKEKVHKEEVVIKKKFGLTSLQKDIVLGALVVILLVVVGLVTSNKEEKVDIELPVALAGEAGFNEITYSDYLNKIESDEPFLVVIVKDGCGYCEMYEPILEEVAGEYNLPINYINLTNLSEDEYSDLAESNSYLKKNQWGTPTTLFMVGDTVVDSIGGYVDKDKFLEFVNDNFVVNNDAE